MKGGYLRPTCLIRNPKVNVEGAAAVFPPPELSRALHNSPELARARQSSPELSRALQSSQIGKWWFGLSQMHSLVFVVFHLCWNTNRKVVVWPQPNAHFCDRCVPFVKITNRKVVVWPQPNAHFCDRCVQLVMLWDGSQM